MIAGARAIGSATSTSTWLASLGQAEQRLRGGERHEDVAAVVLRHADIEESRRRDSARCAAPCEDRRRAPAASTRVSVSPGCRRMRCASRAPITHAVARRRSRRGRRRRMPRGDDARGRAAPPAACRAARPPPRCRPVAGQQHLALDDRARPAPRRAGARAAPAMASYAGQRAAAFRLHRRGGRSARGSGPAGRRGSRSSRSSR